VVAYLTLAEIGKAFFFRVPRPPGPRIAKRRSPEHRRVLRMASHWTHPRPVHRDPKAPVPAGPS